MYVLEMVNHIMQTPSHTLIAVIHQWASLNTPPNCILWNRLVDGLDAVCFDTSPREVM
jgi:hypothetical protein